MAERAPPKRPESDSDVSPAVVEAMESRISNLEDQIDQQQRTIRDAIAMVNDLQDTVDDLQEADS
jgi:hypothetical protein